ncbi:HPP family protein [Priestia filamentosa]|uniref:HPP family protein n=1 Tax=Priestia filamentosa TaxID=1402861 RepID=UPI002E235A6A|nr:HPP family protein [Priestia filamentosa]
MMEKKLEKNVSNGVSVGVNTYLRKMKGEGRGKIKINYGDSIVSATGVLIAIIIISFMTLHLGYPMAIAPLGASCILIFEAHKGAWSQPRNVIGGHLLSTTSALIIWSLLGKSLFSIGIVLAIVLILMALTNTLHPPAAASALVVVNNQTGWGFLVPIFLGVLLLIFISIFYNNLFSKRQYPQHWL